MKKERRAAPFFGLNDRMPLLLALLLGFQHALAMLAGVITYVPQTVTILHI
jgi:xanthine/uracil permease